MLTLELSSILLEIPYYDAYTSLSPNLIVVQHSVKSTAKCLVVIGKSWESNFEH